MGDYAFLKRGVSAFDLRDPYHLAVTLTWPQFFVAFASVYVSVNLLFAILYTVMPGCVANTHPGSFLDAFFFSFETLATVGYGDMHPATTYGHTVAAAEIMCGLVFTAILTGLIFVRFARPRAKFIMADNLIVTPHNGAPTLMFRFGNGRVMPLINVRAKLNVLMEEVSAEGARFRRAQELPLQRSHMPVFPLIWTIMHRMDESSPLFGFDVDRMMEADVRFFLTLEAYDPVLSNTVHELTMFGPHRIVFGMRYADMIGAEEDGTPVADMRLIGALQPDTGPAAPTSGWTDVERAETAQ